MNALETVWALSQKGGTPVSLFRQQPVSDEQPSSEGGSCTSSRTASRRFISTVSRRLPRLPETAVLDNDCNINVRFVGCAGIQADFSSLIGLRNSNRKTTATGSLRNGPKRDLRPRFRRLLLPPP